MARLDEMLTGAPTRHGTTSTTAPAPTGPRLDRRGLPMPSWWPGAAEAARTSVSAMTEIQPTRRR